MTDRLDFFVIEHGGDIVSQLYRRAKAAGLTHPQLELALGWGRGTSRNYAAGNTVPSLARLHQLMDLLGVEPALGKSVVHVFGDTPSRGAETTPSLRPTRGT